MAQTPIIDGGSVGTPPAKKAPAKKAVKKAPAKPAAAGYTATTWAQALLTRLGAPVTAQNVQAITSWEAAEGGHWNNTARYNPLGTTATAANMNDPALAGSYVMPGGGAGADAGVQAYTSWDQGLHAAVAMLNQGNMSAIKSALMRGNDAHAVADAVVNHSPWGTKSITIGNYSTYGTNKVTVPAGEAQTGANTVTYGGNVDAGQTGTPKSLSVKQYLDNPDVASTYGYLSAYLKDKEIGPILAKAAKEGWGENELLGALEKTKFWQKTSETSRSWQAQQKLDPATAKQRLGQMTGQVQQLAQSTLGQALDDKRAGQIANTALAQGWSQAQLQSAVGAEFHYNASQAAYGGLAGQTLDALKGHAADYLVPLSDQTLQTWTQGVLKGTFKDTDFQDYLKSQAESLYPTLKTALDSGVTTRQFLNPYAQMVQQTLGKNPDGIDWMDPKWSKALNTTTPDGQRAPMSLSDWGTYLRSTPDYQYTDQARQNASDLASQLVQHLGKVQV